MRFCWKCWLGAFAATVILCLIGIAWLDIPIALFFQDGSKHWNSLGDALGSAILVSLITIIVVPLAVLRLMRGSLSDFAETIIVSGCTALVSFTVNDFVLKRIFGRLTVHDFLSAPHGSSFRPFDGGMYSSFPSGHAVMAAAGLFVFARVYPDKLILVAGALFIMAAALLAGDWHFLSDIIAGIFLGALAGALSGDLAKSHFEQKRLRR